MLYWKFKNNIIPLSETIPKNSVMEPRSLNLDPEPRFWPNFDPDPDPLGTGNAIE